MLSTRAVFDGVSVPTNAITLSSTFRLAYQGQFLNKQPPNQPQPGNSPIVAFDAVKVILSLQTINYGSEPLDANKLYRSSYERKSSFVIAFGTEFDLQLELTVIIARVAKNNVL
ncbi:MAG: hypothetical protein EZS28_016476 [Streblomastix strix]|uniref:Uncharacterized protein n=1 Tax=Streblomastix strix TaxID=222440 RepID=A0A5J4VZA9_9EUKA|nr:MAG: hypothetical protein EZS28_016476 [Streblomastix strix]